MVGGSYDIREQAVATCNSTSLVSQATILELTTAQFMNGLGLSINHWTEHFIYSNEFSCCWPQGSDNRRSTVYTIRIQQVWQPWMWPAKNHLIIWFAFPKQLYMYMWFLHLYNYIMNGHTQHLTNICMTQLAYIHQYVWDKHFPILFTVTQSQYCAMKHISLFSYYLYTVAASTFTHITFWRLWKCALP